MINKSVPEYIRFLIMNDTRSIINSQDIIDDQETIISVKQSLTEYKTGKYEALRNDKDIDTFIQNMQK